MEFKPITTGIMRMCRMRMVDDDNTSIRKRYKATALLPKSDLLTWKKINNAIADAIGSAVKNQWRDVFLEKIKMPILDGDATLENNKVYGPECAGHYIITSASAVEPKMVDIKLQSIVDPEEIYDGIYVCVSLMFYPYITDDNVPGIGCTLGPIMKVADGDYLPWSADPVWLAFKDISSINAKNPTLQKQPAKFRKTIMPISDEPEIDADAPPWDDEKFLEMMDVMKNRKFSLDELKEFADS